MESQRSAKKATFLSVAFPQDWPLGQIQVFPNGPKLALPKSQHRLVGGDAVAMGGLWPIHLSVARMNFTSMKTTRPCLRHKKKLNQDLF